MNIMGKKICFGIIVGTRGFFNPALAIKARKDLFELLDEQGYEYVVGSEEATPYGAVETFAHSKYYAELFKQNAEKIDGIIVVLPNFGDELGVINTIDMAKLNVPVLVQACNDELDKVDVSSRRDAFCGKISVCNNLYNYGIKFTDTTSHTCDISGDIFAGDVKRFAAVCRTVRGLRNARIGTIGTRPGVFQTVRYSEKLLQKSGITVVPADLSKILAAANSVNENGCDFKNKLSEIKGYGDIPDRIMDDQISRQAKLSVAVENWMEENECVAGTIQCWDSIEKNYGCAACLTMSMMGEKRMPFACEVDVMGAISMYTLLLAASTPPGLLDWNNNYANEIDKCVNTHCSNYPKSFMGATPEVSELDILGATLGREKCFGAVKGKVVAGPMTYFRLSSDDINGCLKAYVGEGEFTDDPFGMDGGIAVCKIPHMRKLLKYMCSNGFEHHVAMVRTNVSDIVSEAVENYMGWDLYNHDEA